MATSRSQSLEKHFPKLRSAPYEVTSLATPAYHCIAWAAGDDARWWEPDPGLIYYWPPQLPREYTLDAYAAAFGTLGYSPCDNSDYAPRVEKLALFAKHDSPTHAARQLSDGRWSSKCGRLEDISHELSDLEGDLYGSATVIFSRALR